MIKLEYTDVWGWKHAIRGMRNPMNSWDKSDSKMVNAVMKNRQICPGVEALDYEPCEPYFSVGPNDYKLMMQLRNAGPDHRKFMRQIFVSLDITAPLYWWKEFDTYKVGTVANSCSTMHKIHDKHLTIDDFSVEHLIPEVRVAFEDTVIQALNECRDLYVGFDGFKDKYGDLDKKDYWWQMIQLLPTSYNQKRTVTMNYENLMNMYHARKNHKLDEWREFCKWIEGLPYSELIIGGKDAAEDIQN